MVAADLGMGEIPRSSWHFFLTRKRRRASRRKRHDESQGIWTWAVCWATFSMFELLFNIDPTLFIFFMNKHTYICHWFLNFSKVAVGHAIHRKRHTLRRQRVSPDQDDDKKQPQQRKGSRNLEGKGFQYDFTYSYLFTSWMDSKCPFWHAVSHACALLHLLKYDDYIILYLSLILLDFEQSKFTELFGSVNMSILYNSIFVLPLARSKRRRTSHIPWQAQQTVKQKRDQAPRNNTSKQNRHPREIHGPKQSVHAFWNAQHRWPIAA